MEDQLAARPVARGKPRCRSPAGGVVSSRVLLAERAGLHGLPVLFPGLVGATRQGSPGGSGADLGALRGGHVPELRLAPQRGLRLLLPPPCCSGRRAHAPTPQRARDAPDETPP